MGYGGRGLELKQWSLDMGIQCNPLYELLSKELKGWCKTGICQRNYPGHLKLLEGHKRRPWELLVYRNTGKKIMKTAICSRPARPTTRSSPEGCCVRKTPMPGQTPTRAELTLATLTRWRR